MRDGTIPHIGDHPVSTVWLGLDHQFEKYGAPMLFETMVFDLLGEPQDQKRYTTLRAAQEGHKRFVQQLCKELS
jgi:hypothetical protein